jgi:hypothetical protein
MKNPYLKGFVQFVNENLNENSTPEYDEILDLYNELGLDGMSKDEIDFLKSGGQTKLPNRFKTRDLLDKHRETTKSHEYWRPSNPSIDEESYRKINRLKKILDKYPDWVIDYPFEGVGWGLGNLFSILFKDEKPFDELVEALYDSKENYENRDKDLISSVFVRTEEDWSKKHNSHRNLEDIPGQEYKIGITIPKKWYEDLFKNHFR